MERQGTIKQMVGAMAPAAPQPGRGTGNIPYAKGMVSGTFGAPPASAPRPTGGPPVEAMPPGTPQPLPARGGPPPPMAAPPPAAAQNPFLDPMLYFDVMGSIMAALVTAAASIRATTSGRSTGVR